MKITRVGAICAEYIAIKNFASEVVILDIKEGYAEGKAMDLMQCASINGFDTKIKRSSIDYSKTAGIVIFWLGKKILHDDNNKLFRKNANLFGGIIQRN